MQDLAPAGLISMAFAVSVATCVKRRNQPTANGTGRRPTKTTITPSMLPERGTHARGRSGNFCSHLQDRFLILMLLRAKLNA